MGRLKKKTTEEIAQDKLQEFITSMKNAGVKEKTINRVIKEIKEYQKALLEKQLKELFKLSMRGE